jgi:hypothetical protein
VFRGIPDTPYKLFGISGIETRSDLVSFELGISASYVLVVDTFEAALTVAYLYFAPSTMNCTGCSHSVIYRNQCLAECPKETYLFETLGAALCRNCPP